jgi:hypothetical protein
MPKNELVVDNTLPEFLSNSLRCGREKMHPVTGKKRCSY